MSENDAKPAYVTLNRCFMRFNDRAERLPAHQIVDTFVSVGPMLDVLANRSHQIIYGRRGVGKTHALRYFQSQSNNSEDCAVYIDCANLGSSNSVYSDDTLKPAERATRLLIDVCVELHQQLLERLSDPLSKSNLAEFTSDLNGFVDAISQIRVEGPVIQEVNRTANDQSDDRIKISGSLGTKLSLGFDASLGAKTEANLEVKERREGNTAHLVNFQFLFSRFSTLAKKLAPRRVWLLIDEWSTIPMSLQPFLADLLRRSFFGVPNLSVKIAAIEQRSKFKMEEAGVPYIGIELGADATVALNLDDYLVYDANRERSIEFFRLLFEKHLASVSKEDNIFLNPYIPARWNYYAFTQENVFVELVRACEGVPRDAMHILSNAAQRTPDDLISAPTLRAAALQFFQTEKYGAIAANELNRKMLEWIRFKVIDQRNTRAFLLPVGTVDDVVDKLFDLRALHILNRSMSAAHRPGERYVVYKIDYGCYVDLTNTGKFPSGGLLEGNPDFSVDFEVPDDDARSYRRAILDLKEFYATL